jgi:hypothetical protein
MGQVRPKGLSTNYGLGSFWLNRKVHIKASRVYHKRELVKVIEAYLLLTQHLQIKVMEGESLLLHYVVLLVQVED